MTEEKDQTNQTSVNPENIENIKKLKDLLNSDNSDIFAILALKQKVTFDDKSEAEKINCDIWQKQYNMIFPPKDSQKKKKPNINQLNLLLSSAEEYKIKDNDKINKIKYLQEEGNNIIKEVSKIKSLLQLNIYKSNTQNINLDLSEYFIQREMKIRATKEEPITTNPISKQQDTTDNKNPILSLVKELSNKPKQRKKTYKKKEDSYEADFIHDEEDSEDSEIDKNIELNKKKSSSFKLYANALQKEAENFVNSRSRRNVSKKRDDDFVYDDDLNQEGEKDELGLELGEEKNESNIHNKRKKKENEGDEEYSEDSFEEKKEKKVKEKLLNKKVKRPEKKTSTNKILPLNSNKENKLKSRQKALMTITDILKENKYLMEEGIDFVTALATRVEEDLAKSYPEIDFDYQKTLSNMNKTMKEMAKFKRINQFIIKGKLNLFKTAKFPFGEKFIQKLKQIEEGNKNKKPNNNNTQKQKSTTSLDILNPITGKNKPEKEKDKLNLNKTMSGVSYRSGISFLSQSSFNEERNDNNNYNYNYNNEDSIDSNEDQGNIKFSPGGNNGKNNEGPNNLEEGLGHTYDPFELDKIDTKNLLFPILFDPSLSHEEEEEMVEENISNQENEEEDYNINNIVDPPPKGSVLRIYKGKIKLNHNIIDKVSLYSFNKFEKFLKFPSFEKELILPSKAKSNEVIPYCLKQLNNNSKTELFGWIEPEPNKNNENVESTKFSELIEEFERNEKCSCLVDNKIKLYIFTLGEKDEKLYKKIIKKNKFINKRFMDNLNSGNKYLVFVLLANNDDLEKDVIKKKKKMSPEIINKVDVSESEEEEDDLILNKNKNLSMVTEEDEENMPSSSFKKTNNQEEENDNENEEDEESLIDKEENEKLRVILEKNDFNIINEYIENNFKDLPLEEMAVKLQRFSADNREKLLMIIKNYSEQFPQNDNQMDVDEDNNNMNQMQQINNVGMMNDMNNMNQNYGINMYQNDPAINQIYLGGINNMNNIQQQNNNNPNINPNLQQLYYNQGINIYNNYNNNFK